MTWFKRNNTNRLVDAIVRGALEARAAAARGDTRRVGRLLPALDVE